MQMHAGMHAASTYSHQSSLLASNGGHTMRAGAVALHKPFIAPHLPWHAAKQRPKHQACLQCCGNRANCNACQMHVQKSMVECHMGRISGTQKPTGSHRPQAIRAVHDGTLAWQMNCISEHQLPPHVAPMKQQPSTHGTGACADALTQHCLLKALTSKQGSQLAVTEQLRCCLSGDDVVNRTDGALDGSWASTLCCATDK